MTRDEPTRYQREILPQVSRTFALTIPRLPAGLRDVVANAYLLCRIADTIEDEPALTIAAKERLHGLFVDAVNGSGQAETFAHKLAPLLPETAPERDLVAHTPLVLQKTARCSPRQRAAIERCVAVMCAGMPRFERQASREGLADLDEMRDYCDVVAGIVGETLTELFCDYSPTIARQYDAMSELSVSFGRGLQMTNILKDFWEDHDRGVCWLPRDVFAQRGVRLGQVTREHRPSCFGTVYDGLIAVAHRHLQDAVDYTLLVPASEKGIRGFCAIALGLALSTLQCINRRRDFTAGSQVKVSRRVVASTMVASRRFASGDDALRRWLGRLGEGLPAPASDIRSTPPRLRESGRVGDHSEQLGVAGA